MATRRERMTLLHLQTPALIQNTAMRYPICRKLRQRTAYLYLTSLRQLAMYALQDEGPQSLLALGGLTALASTASSWEPPRQSILAPGLTQLRSNQQGKAALARIQKSFRAPTCPRSTERSAAARADFRLEASTLAAAAVGHLRAAGLE